MAEQQAQQLTRVQMKTTKPGLSMTCFSQAIEPKAKETREDRTKSYIEKFQTISNQLVGVQNSGVQAEEQYL